MLYIILVLGAVIVANVAAVGFAFGYKAGRKDERVISTITQIVAHRPSRPTINLLG